MSPSASGYFAHLTRVCWSFLLSIFYFRNRKNLSSPELPTFVTNHESECDVSGGLESWKRDKQQFLRRPSLLRAHTRARETRQKSRHTVTPPPPEIYIEDWSSLGLNMADLFETPFSVVSRSGAAGSGVSTTSHSYGLDTVPENPSEHLANDSVSSPTLPVSQPNTSSENPSAASSTPGSPALESNTTSEHLATDDLSSLGSSVEDFSDGRSPLAAALTETPPSKPEAESSVDLDQDAQEVAGVAESATLSFSAGLYASNALSAVSGLLWDPPTFSISHSTPLPDVAPFLSNLQTTLTLGRDSLQPYPDLFDFSMYTRRISRESFCEVIELPSFSVDEPSEKTRPVSIYDVVHERDRYRSAAYSSCISSPVRTSSSPRRPPFSSTLNLDSGRDASAFSHVIAEKSDADGTPTGNDMGGQFMMMCDKLSRCEWTEEEFLKLFASSGTV